MVVFLIGIMMLLVTGCTERTPAVGADGEPACVVCTAQHPYWRACESIMVASGGQPVCEDTGSVVLCMSVRRCQAQHRRGP
ncbi:MAG: hypothetical protein VX589_20320 [Myxococcota bacterium]|nr:hypothetical protein [Myxococcota bacterium]